MPSYPRFPTDVHEKAAEAVTEYFSHIPGIDTVLVVNSCARGQATADSDLDFAILVAPGISTVEIQEMDSQWQEFTKISPALSAYRASGPSAHLHLDLITGEYRPGDMEAGGMPDFFEVEIGNQVCYSAPMGEAGLFFRELKRRWLPYYEEDLRLQRLRMTRESCEYDLVRIPSYLERGLYFHAFDRLTVAFQKFLQALFISRKTYPIAYNKWIRLQVESWLGMPELYRQLPPLISVSNIETIETGEKAAMLKELLNAL